jgi:peptidoglycan/LPS O-acetylase OafA/YrhL
MGGFTLVIAFVAGVAGYKFRDKIPCSAARCVLCLLFTMASFLVAGLDRLAIIPAAYVTVYLGMLNPPRQKLLLSVDYSYGIFLYGLPIQQTIAWWSPALRNWRSAFVAVPIVVAVAVAFWWLIEKPILDRRAVLKALEARVHPRRPF